MSEPVSRESLAERTRIYIDAHPSIKDCVAKGLINYSSLARMIMKDLEVENERIVDSVVHEYPDKTIRLTLVECTPKAGSVPHPNEHQDIRWATREELESLDFAPADRDLIRRGFI